MQEFNDTALIAAADCRSRGLQILFNAEKKEGDLTALAGQRIIAVLFGDYAYASGLRNVKELATASFRHYNPHSCPEDTKACIEEALQILLDANIIRESSRGCTTTIEFVLGDLARG